VTALALTEQDARTFTDEVKADAHALWRKLVTLYEMGAHTALGYSSWGAYCAAEFDMGQSSSYRMLDSARVVETLTAHSPMGEPVPATERVARELAPLRDQPDVMAGAWHEAIGAAEADAKPVTALHVRAAVQAAETDIPAADTPDVVSAPAHAVHFSSASDEWATPQAFFDLVAREFAFTLDVCALPSSAKCARYFTPQDNGLAHDWTGVCWMNPPYGDAIPDWVRKADESATNGTTIVALLPARVDTGWWWNHVRHHEIRFLKGRLKFGDSPNSAPFPSAVVVFGRPENVIWWQPTTERSLHVAA